MSDKDRIKQELERIEQILDDFNKTHNNIIDNGIVSAKKNICKYIKSFIDSLSKQPASEDRINECPYWEKYWGCATSPMNNCDSCPLAKWVEAKDEKIISPISDDLDEEIENYIKESLAIKFPTTDKEQIKADIRYIARHFAEWQHGKDFDDLLQSEMKFPKEFYEKGRFDMREEMMKDSVKGEIGDIMPLIEVGEMNNYLKYAKAHGLKPGDKVKIIIIKEK